MGVYGGDYGRLFDAVNASVFSYNRQRHHSALGTTPDAYALKNAKKHTLI